MFTEECPVCGADIDLQDDIAAIQGSNLEGLDITCSFCDTGLSVQQVVTYELVVT